MSYTIGDLIRKIDSIEGLSKSEKELVKFSLTKTWTFK